MIFFISIKQYMIPAVLVLVLSVHAGSQKKIGAAIEVAAMFCEHMTDPIAVDTRRPLLSWVLSSESRGTRQTAYRIVVARELVTLTHDTGDLWDSGKVESDTITGVRYGGSTLAPGDACWWKVRVWNEHGQPSVWSEPGKWEIGLLDSSDWHASWIAQKTGNETPSPLFRQEFMLRGRIRRARACIYGLGWYELYLNGAKVDNHVLAPPNSHYDRMNLYNTYDVTAMLAKGGNAVGVMLGGGYGSTYSKWGWKWEKSKRFIFQMRIELTDGSIREIVSDGEWTTASGPITACDIYDGERYDARMESPGWCAFGYDDDSWTPAVATDSPGGCLIPNTMPPVRVTQTLIPAAIFEPAPGVYVADMGQNFSGWARISLFGARGDSVKMHYSELVDTTGRIDPWTNRKAQATDIYILRGGGQESYEPRFTYHGFRYVEVTGLQQPLTRDMIQGRVVHADLGITGSFACSDPLLTRISENFQWSMRSNFMGIPTDCPARDERTPCAMDSRVVEEGAMYLFPMYRYYAKWLRDIAGGNGNPDWDSDQVLLPWRMYLWYGDMGILEEHYPSMKRYVSAVRARTPNLIYREGFGDWCAPNIGTWESYFSNVAPVNTALFLECARAVAGAAEVLQDIAAVHRFSSLADSIRDAYNNAFFHKDRHYYGNATQTEDILPLAFSLVPKGQDHHVVNHLVSTVMVDKNGHLDTGITGTRYIGDVLVDWGYPNIAFKVLTQRTYPGFGNQVSLGATTTWEQWYAKGGMNSHNHAMFSGALATLFSRFGGIQPLEPGFRRYIVKPAVTDSLSWVRVRVGTVRGPVESHWTCKGGILTLHVLVPVGAEAEVHVESASAEAVSEGGIPASRAIGVRHVGRRGRAEVYMVGSGVYDFSAPLN